MIPKLNNREAFSLNQAYTLISQKYEKHRGSHTGNVFNKVFYQEGDDYYPLETLRNQIVYEIEEKIGMNYPGASPEEFLRLKSTRISKTV